MGNRYTIVYIKVADVWPLSLILAAWESASQLLKRVLPLLKARAFKVPSTETPPTHKHKLTYTH